jgi:hypothetical protein
MVIKGSSTPQEAAKKHKEGRIRAKKSGGGRGPRIVVRTPGNTALGTGPQAAKRRKARLDKAKANSRAKGPKTPESHPKKKK